MKGIPKELLDKLLIVLIIILIGANLWVIGRNHFFRPTTSLPSWAEEMYKAIYEKPFKKDPPLGLEVKVMKQYPGRRFVVVLERCTDCVAQTLKAWSEIVKALGLPNMIVVTQDNLKQATETLHRLGIEAEVIVDSGGKIAQKLNAFFTPRVYIFENGKLVWKQEKLSPQEALSGVRGL